MPKATGTSRTRRTGQGTPRRARNPKSVRVDRPGRPEPALETATPSPTAVAAEAQRTGVLPRSAAEGLDPFHRHDEERLLAEADRRALAEDDVGDQGPGGSMMNPELNRVDAIGRAAGIQEEDSGALRTSAEILDGRDKRRAMAETPEPNPLTRRDTED